jgi:hypothetical protein
VITLLLLAVLASAVPLAAEPVPVRHLEGVTFGFLVLRNTQGEILAHGELQQVVKPNDPIVMMDLMFRFLDGSSYREITKFTQKGVFRLVSDQVSQKGPAFKQDRETWIEARSGKITVRTSEKGKEKDKATTKHLDLPSDVANGLLFIIAKNLNPAVDTEVSFVAASDKPLVVKMQIRPGPEKDVNWGGHAYKAQHYVVHVKIPGATGVVASVLGKEPSDLHLWTLKSEAPTFIEFEGPLSQDTPVWRIELSAPAPESSEKPRE